MNKTILKIKVHLVTLKKEHEKALSKIEKLEQSVKESDAKIKRLEGNVEVSVKHALDLPFNATVTRFQSMLEISQNTTITNEKLLRIIMSYCYNSEKFYKDLANLEKKYSIEKNQ